MTHEDPSIREPNVVKAEEMGLYRYESEKEGMESHKKLPKLVLEGNRWIVENHTNNRNIVIEHIELRHSVYVFNCVNCVVYIRGKLNQVTIGRFLN
jgi:adenylyl cyclase-associated protein